jgi:Asp-tRNA(Asn)/Glu-tRNA(Gln) amidotransferase A subunit family amidase
MARTVEDVALVFHALTSRSTGAGAWSGALKTPSAYRLGRVTNFTGTGAVTAGYSSVLEAFRAIHGMALDPVEVPFASASFDLRRVDDDRARISGSLFKNLSALVLPTLAAPAPTITEARAQGEMAVSPANTFFGNYYGLPAISIPTGLDEHGLPTAIQLVGPQGRDVDLLGLARDVECALNVGAIQPPVTARLEAHA